MALKKTYVHKVIEDFKTEVPSNEFYSAPHGRQLPKIHQCDNTHVPIETHITVIVIDWLKVKATQLQQREAKGLLSISA